MNNFEKIFDKLSSKHEPNRIFDEFLDYCIDINLFTTINQNLDFQGREKDYFEMFQEWVKITDTALNNPTNEINSSKNGWYDYLGIFYENIVQSKYKAGARGQFFTPADVCQIMTEIIIDDDQDYTDKLVNDCCCGSGRFLLAGHSLMPGAIMIGSDLDDVACKMTVLNFYIHGVRGSVLHMNALTLECFQCWRVNNYLNYGLPIPHIELVNENDVYNFFGVNNEKVETVELNESIPKNTVQSKLW